MSARAALEAALPPEARVFLSPHVDPADAFIAWCTNLTPGQARSRARNAARSLGSKWPDRMPRHALVDPDELLEIQHSCGLHAFAPDEILEAVEQVELALGGGDAALRLAAADLQEVDTKALSQGCQITQRRAQQIKKSRVDLAERQLPLPLFLEVEGGEE